MSTLLKQNRSKEHEISDDLESFVHVLTWSSMRYYFPSYSVGNKWAVSSALYLYFNAIDPESWELYHALCDGRDIADDLRHHMKRAHPLNTMRQELVKLLQEHYKSLGQTMTLPTVKRPMGGRVFRLRKSKAPGAVGLGSTSGPSVATRTIRVPESDTPTLSVDVPAVIDLSDDPTTSDSDQPQPSPDLKTPATSPLYTHARFVETVRTFLIGPAWYNLEKYTKPLPGWANSTPFGSDASSGRRRRPSDDESLNLRPYKRAKPCPGFDLNEELTEPEEEPEHGDADVMDVQS